MKLIDIKVEGEKIRLVHGQETAPILQANYEDRENTEENWKRGKDMKHVARIPMIVWEELDRLGITQDKHAFVNWLRVHGKEYLTTKKQI